MHAFLLFYFEKSINGIIFKKLSVFEFASMYFVDFSEMVNFWVGVVTFFYCLVHQLLLFLKDMPSFEGLGRNRSSKIENWQYWPLFDILRDFLGVTAFSKVPTYRKAAHYWLVEEYRGRWAVTQSVSEFESAEPRVKN